MQTKVIEIDTELGISSQIAEAVALLNAGDVVATPTETVYGLAADATQIESVTKIFEAKGRPHTDPLIVHIGSKSDLKKVATVPVVFEELVANLVEKFWPGPLTILLPKTDLIPDLVTAGLPNVAVRMSAHPVMRQLARDLGRPIAAPSANRFGRISPTSAKAVMEELEGKIPMILDAGACSEGVESTIIELDVPEKNKPIIRVLRPGPVTREMLREFGQVKMPSKKASDPIVAPGQMESHYAPSKPMILLEKPEDFQPEEGVRYGLLSYRGLAGDGYLNLHPWTQIQELSPGNGKHHEAALRLYFVMRLLDQDDEVDVIISEPVNDVGLGTAILDRLRRASAKR